MHAAGAAAGLTCCLLACSVGPLDDIPCAAGLTVYSGVMFGRLRLAVPDAVLFGDIGQAAFGRLVICFRHMLLCNTNDGPINRGLALGWGVLCYATLQGLQTLGPMRTVVQHACEGRASRAIRVATVTIWITFHIAATLPALLANIAQGFKGVRVL